MDEGGLERPEAEGEGDASAQRTDKDENGHDGGKDCKADDNDECDRDGGDLWEHAEEAP